MTHIVPTSRHVMAIKELLEGLVALQTLHQLLSGCHTQAVAIQLQVFQLRVGGKPQPTSPSRGHGISHQLSPGKSWKLERDMLRWSHYVPLIWLISAARCEHVRATLESTLAKEHLHHTAANLVLQAVVAWRKHARACNEDSAGGTWCVSDAYLKKEASKPSEELQMKLILEGHEESRAECTTIYPSGANSGSDRSDSQWHCECLAVASLQLPPVSSWTFTAKERKMVCQWTSAKLSNSFKRR